MSSIRGEVSSGQVLGSCRILEQIGQGGMGTVYRAVQDSLNRVVAVKVISPLLVSDATALARFRREAQTVASFRHAHILNVYDFGEQDGIAYLVMEYAAGGTLRAHMSAPFGILETVRLLTPIAQALDYAHGRGVVHRDVKPANVLIHADGTLVLSDFGLAYLSMSAQPQQLTSTGLMVGTPAYMAPEQGRLSQVGPAADRYSLGVIAYELLTSTVPFSGETPIAIVLAHIQDPVPPIRERNPDLPASAEAVLQQALAKQPVDRFATAAAFVQALESAALMAVPVFAVSPAQPARRQALVGATTITSAPPRAPAQRHERLGRRGLLVGGAVAGALMIAVLATLAVVRVGGIDVFGPVPEPTPIREANWQVLPAPITGAFSTVAVDRAGFVYVVADDHRIQKVSPAGQTVGGPWGTSGGPVYFDQPRGIAVDDTGTTLYVSEGGNAKRVQKLAPFDTDWLRIVSHFAARGGAQLGLPGGVAGSSDGTIYIADAANNRILKLGSTGELLASWGSQGAAAGQFNGPLAVAVDRQASVYVADTSNHRVQKLSPSGEPLAQWGSHGSAGGQFSSPSGIALDGDGNIVVADTQNNRLQKLSPKGVLLAQWSRAGPQAGEFNEPTGLAVDQSGTIYVADSGNRRLLKLAAPRS